MRMFKPKLFLRLLAGLTMGLMMTTSQAATETTAASVRVLMQTSQGDIVLELNRAKAPVTVDNFLRYVNEKFYDGTIFHRVIADFMIQGGGFDAQYQQKPTHAPIKNEASNGLKNERGSIAMARTSDPNSATAQFFINLVDNKNLDYPSFDGYGYAVFGEVVSGMDVVDKIAALPTGAHPPFHSDVPATQVVIKHVSVIPPDTD